MPNLIKMALGVLKIAVVIYVGACVLLFFYQPRKVYVPLAVVLQKPSDIGLAYEPVTLLTEDNVRLAGWYVPCAEARGAIIICHGNSGNIGDNLYKIDLFHKLGLNVLIFDYRGYGESAGNPDEKGTYRDARAAWQYLVEQRNLPPDKIIIFGRSLGGAVAASLAEQVVPAALILESTFTSIPDVGALVYPWLPVRLICRYRYNTLARMERIRCPVLIAHSREDGMIPFLHGRKLFAAAREPKTFVELSGDHNDGEVLISTDYRQALDNFLTVRLGKNLLKK